MLNVFIFYLILNSIGTLFLFDYICRRIREDPPDISWSYQKIIVFTCIIYIFLLIPIVILNIISSWRTKA